MRSLKINPLKHLFYGMTYHYELRKRITIELSGKSLKNFNGCS